MQDQNRTGEAIDGDATAPVSGRTRFVRALWMTLGTTGIGLVLVWILTPHRGHQVSSVSIPISSTDAVTVLGPSRIAIAPDSPLAARLDITTIESRKIATPLLVVTGSVVARIRTGSDALEERWQFASSELTAAYADWLQAKADVEFNRQQLQATSELTRAQETRLKEVVTRLEQVTGGGSVPRKDLLEAEANLVQARLQGQKDVFAAESELRSSLRHQAALERQLVQSGIEPVVLARAREGMVLIAANVPESKISMVHVGQGCEARFYGYPRTVYSAHVEELGSIVNPELRTMRVLFDLDDAEYYLRPGMFAEVGLGTNEREALMVPASAVIHIGREDYVFRQDVDGLDLAVTEVTLGETVGSLVEVVTGLRPGDRIATKEAILLKPVAVRSLTR